MISRLILGCVCISLIIGCATTHEPTDVNTLQIKVSHMERRIEEQSQEIDELKYEIKELTGQIEYLDIERVSEPISKPQKTIVISTSPSSKKSKGKSLDIIRISVSPSEVQKALKSAGYYDGPIDGKIGDKSQNAIKQFQKDHDLESDGIIGRKTWIELKNYQE